MSGRIARRLVTLWTVLGVAALFGWAIYRLGSRGIDTVGSGLGVGEWMACALFVAAFTYGEGFLALDRRWVPGLMERARRLPESSAWILRILAPLHGLSLIGVGWKDLLRAWAGVGAIVAAVAIVQMLPEPWRGIVDLSVAVALAWGLVAIIRRLPRAIRERVRPSGSRALSPEEDAADAHPGLTPGASPPGT